MNGRYKRQEFLLLQFDLKGTDLVLAYRAVHALNALGVDGQLGEQIAEMVHCLRHEVVVYQKNLIEASHFNICIKCTQEVNLHLNNHTIDEEGNYTHKVCPFFRLPRME